MPDYPDASTAVQTDIRLFSTDIQAFTDGGTKDLVVRTVLEPATMTCVVSVHVGDVPGGGMGRLIAQRVIFTGTIANPVMTPEEAEAEFRRVEE